MKANVYRIFAGFGLTLFLFGLTNEIYSQNKLDSLIKNHFYAGLGVGPETAMSGFLPKISFYNFNERKRIESYYGIEGSIWIVEAGWFSADFLYGIKKNIFTIDNSIGVWWYPKTDEKRGVESIGPYFHCTMNPKIGIKFWKIWLKAGPSLFLYKDYANDINKPGVLELTKIGNVYYNFEILIKI